MKAIAFVGWSGSGKTTLLERLLPVVGAQGLRVGYLKTDAHGFTMDRTGKDTARLFDAGAPIVAIIGPDEAAVRSRPGAEVSLEEFLTQNFHSCDLVLVEGGKRSALPKIELLHGADPAVQGDPDDLLALVGDAADARERPRFARDDIDGIARFVLEWFRPTIRAQ